MSRLIEAQCLVAGYGKSAVVRDLDLFVEEGEIVALFGPNGAGKTTTLMTLCGELPALSGDILLDGVSTSAPLFQRARRGMGLVTEQKSVFTRLTVAENLRVSHCDQDRAMALFPELEHHLDRRAGLLSGGQQQMLALARALARGVPRLLLIDEISLGLAPQLVDRLMVAIKDAATAGVGVLLVEQYIHKAMAVADRVYVMRRGRVQMSGPAAELRSDLDRIQDAYLAGGDVEVGVSASQSSDTSELSSADDRLKR
jgi:branched-chain amino acid transport system ATP-binding protein